MLLQGEYRRYAHGTGNLTRQSGNPFALQLWGGGQDYYPVSSLNYHIHQSPENRGDSHTRAYRPNLARQASK